MEAKGFIRGSFRFHFKQGDTSISTPREGICRNNRAPQ